MLCRYASSQCRVASRTSIMIGYGGSLSSQPATATSAAITNDESLMVALPLEIKQTSRLHVERIIHAFLCNTVRHGYNEVSITCTVPTSLAHRRSFKARGALSDEAVQTSNERIHRAWKYAGASCGLSETEHAGDRQWSYSVDASDGSQSQVLLSCSVHSLIRRTDIHSRAALIGYSHILHHDICAVIAATTRSNAQSLSAREIDALRWTADGKTAAEIAQIIGISRRTVESYISSAMRKLGTSTRSAAAVKAYGLGLLTSRRLANTNAPEVRTEGAHVNQARLVHGNGTGGS